MTSKRESFIFYRSFHDAIKELPESDQGIMCRAICNYSFDQVDPELSGLLKILWILIKPQLDANHKKWTDGNKGGRPKKTSGSGIKKTSGSENNKPNVNVNVNEKENVKEKEKDKNASAISPICFNPFSTLADLPDDFINDFYDVCKQSFLTYKIGEAEEQKFMEYYLACDIDGRPAYMNVANFNPSMKVSGWKGRIKGHGLPETEFEKYINELKEGGKND